MSSGNATYHPRYNRDGIISPLGGAAAPRMRLAPPPAGRIRPRPSVERPRKAAPTAVRPESLTRSAKARAEAGQRVRHSAMVLSPGSVLTFAIVLTLLFFIVYASMNISVSKRDNSRLYEELCALQTAEKELRSEYGGVYNLSEVEAYAQNEKGMIKPGREQIIYVDMVGESGAVILPAQSFWESVGSFFSAIGGAVMDFIG